MKVVKGTQQERAAAVRAFDAVYGDMDHTLWTVSQACRTSLLRHEHSVLLDELVWTLKSWWGVQGVRLDTKHAMAAALIGLEWAPEHFEPTYLPAGAAESFAEEVVRNLVARTKTLGAPRSEYSLASKVLHWLMPWRVPVFDAFVRAEVGVPTSWDAPAAYRAVVDAVFATARDPADEDSTWAGPTEPRSLLHALDKWLWWSGGGRAGTAVVVRDPRQVLLRLGLDP